MEFVADIIKVDPDKRQVFGWAYIAKDKDGRIIIDKQGDFVDSDEELETAAYDFMVNSRRGDSMHFMKGTARLIESIVFTDEKLEIMGIAKGHAPQLAWWIGMEVTDDSTWELVKSGNYKGFSIGGSGMRQKVDDGSAS